MKKLFLLALGACALTQNLKAETVLQQMGRAQDTLAQVEVARFQQEQADRADKIRDQIRQAAIAAQAVREAREAALEKEIERCLLAGLPLPTEASWESPTSAEIARAEFANLMRVSMSARVHQEHSNPQVSELPTAANFPTNDSDFRAYLASLGFGHVSAIELAQVRLWMAAQGIRYVPALSTR